MRKTLKAWTKSRWALPTAGLIGFLENTFVIVAMEPLFLPMMASRGKRAWHVAAALLVGNILGGILFYFLAMGAEDAVIRPIFDVLGMAETYSDAERRMQENGFVALVVIGLTPFPFQLGSAAAGVAGYNFALFLLAVTLSRGVRYGVEALLVMAVGARAEDWIENHETEIFLAGMAVFAGLVLWLVVGG